MPTIVQNYQVHRQTYSINHETQCTEMLMIISQSSSEKRENVESFNTATEQAKYIDRHLGKRLCQQRELLGLSRDELAKLIGTTNEQIHLLEEGINPIFADQLFQFSEVMSVPISYFYEGIQENLI